MDCNFNVNGTRKKYIIVIICILWAGPYYMCYSYKPVCGKNKNNVTDKHPQKDVIQFK